MSLLDGRWLRKCAKSWGRARAAACAGAIQVLIRAAKSWSEPERGRRRALEDGRPVAPGWLMKGRINLLAA